MSESVIYAIERTENPNKARKQGFIPGVIYGKDTKSTSIKLKQKEFNKLLQGHAKNTRLKVKLGDEVKHCVIKEIQKDFVSGKIIHVDLQAVRGNDIIRLRVPIVYHGKEKLGARQQLLQELISEVDIVGKAADLPEFVSIDVGEKNVGDKITVKDIQIGNGIKIEKDEDEILAVVTPIKEYSAETSETTEEATSEAS